MEKRCFSCMNKINSNICDHCGYDNSKAKTERSSSLKPATLLRERYYIGVIIEQNGEGITYIAYDMLDKKRVRIREFFPESLCNRLNGSNLVEIISGCDIQFKSLKSDFAELSKQLIDLQSNNNLLKAKMIFSENNTLYTVYQDVVGMTLTQYLKENAGELSWEETENLFLPLLYTVKLLNSNGITHRGISPETIIVTQHKELKLTGVCTSAARAINSEIKPELFSGYAAPEQYQKCTSYGEWTDVYSISAVLYRTLTGTMPPSAETRENDSNIITPIQLNSIIPKSVSDAITRGLSYKREYRTRYIKDLIGALYASQGPDQSQEEELYDNEASANMRKGKFKLPVWLIVVLITLPVMLILFFITYNYVLGPSKPPSSSDMSSLISEPSSEETSSDDSQSSSNESSKTASDSANNIAVDDFKDKYYDDIETSKTYENMYKFTKKEIYDEIVPIGVVITQSIEPNKVVKAGTEIELTVSKGIRYVTVLPFTDSSGVSVLPDTYQRLLKDFGIDSKIEKVDGNGELSGHIVGLSVDVGSRIDRDTTSSIIIYVAN